MKVLIKFWAPSFILSLALWALIISLLMLTGCATKAKTAFIDADGSSFTAISKAGPFGQLNTDNQKLNYHWDADGSGDIAVGQEGITADNTAQIDAVSAASAIITGLTETVLTVAGPVPSDPAALPAWLMLVRQLVPDGFLGQVLNVLLSN